MIRLNRASIVAAGGLIIDLALIAVTTWLIREVANAIDEATPDDPADLDYMLVSCNGHEPKRWVP